MKRRLRVRFESANRRGFGATVNVSAGGMLVSSRVVLAPGSVVRGRCFLPSGHAEFDFVAKVRWAAKVVVSGLQIPGSMGLQLVSAPPPEYLEIATRSA